MEPKKNNSVTVINSEVPTKEDLSGKMSPSAQDSYIPRIASDAEVIQKKPLFWSKNSMIQLGYGLWVNQNYLIVGLCFGFSAVSIPKLDEPDSEFHATVSEKSWIASILVLMAPIGCIGGGFLMDRFGRRIMLSVPMIPLTVGWLYTGFARKATDMIVGRSITGLAVGFCTGAPRTYATEISLPHIRGVTGVMPPFALALGNAIQALLGKIFPWKTICYISGVYCATLMIINLIILPETPYFVLINGNLEKTKKVLKRFRAKDYDVENELQQMQEFKHKNCIYKLSTKESFNMLLKPYSYKPFLIMGFFIITGQTSGINVLIFYSVEILKEGKLSFDPYVGNIVLSNTRLLGALGTSALVFHANRRPMALTSAFGIFFVCVALGLFASFYQKPSIFPLFAFMIYVVLASIGFYSLPVMMLNELAPLQVRGILTGAAISVVFMSMFIAVNVFPYIKNALGFPVTIFLFAASAFVAGVFIYFKLPETKGLTLQQIEEFYRGRRTSRALERRLTR